MLPKKQNSFGKSSISITLMTTLIAFGGLLGTGKTVVAREVARELNAVYVRIDSIEQAIRASGVLHRTIDDAGYRVAYVIAEDNLRMGRTVVADCVNPIQITRDAWIGVANRAQARTVEVEIVCSDPQQHRQNTLNAFVQGVSVLSGHWPCENLLWA
jgi:predicted kinase